MTGVVTVFGASRTRGHEPDYADAMAMGAAFAGAGLTVATGGYGGLMEAVSRGAASRDGHVIGVTAPDLFPGRVGANSAVTEERPHRSLVRRIDELIEIADAFVALPGSVGTLAELVMVWNVNAIAGLSDSPPRPLATVGPTWKTLIGQLGTTLDADISTVHHAASAAEASDYILQCIGHAD